MCRPSIFTSTLAKSSTASTCAAPLLLGLCSSAFLCRFRHRVEERVKAIFISDARFLLALRDEAFEIAGAASLFQVKTLLLFHACTYNSASAVKSNLST